MGQTKSIAKLHTSEDCLKYIKQFKKINQVWPAETHQELLIDEILNYPHKPWPWEILHQYIPITSLFRVMDKQYSDGRFDYEAILKMIVYHYLESEECENDNDNAENDKVLKSFLDLNSQYFKWSQMHTLLYSQDIFKLMKLSMDQDWDFYHITSTSYTNRLCGQGRKIFKKNIQFLILEYPNKPWNFKNLYNILSNSQYEDMILEYPNKPWSYYHICENYLHLLVSHLELNWDWDQVSQQINLYNILKYPGLPLNYEIICQRNDFDIQIIHKLPHKKWKLSLLIVCEMWNIIDQYYRLYQSEITPEILSQSPSWFFHKYTQSSNSTHVEPSAPSHVEHDESNTCISQELNQIEGECKNVENQKVGEKCEDKGDEYENINEPGQVYKKKKRNKKNKKTICII